MRPRSALLTNWADDDVRARFAWLPVRRWRLVSPYVETCGCYWLRRVIEVRTVWGDWTAYEHNQTPT